ncbi:MAG TPA: AtpZ/AtpI family protein [Pyrinomonadaceae bacterium]|nr:AtpZ/AtpI family protein [Pyrinomonadaceae bacterium]
MSNSSKLPDSPDSSRSTPEENRKAGLAYAAGFTLFATVAAFTGLGYLLDRWLATDPWCLVGGIVLGSAAGLFQFVRLSSKTY